ncbi:hypothetical protein [Pareuzebyella sediminis]|uniref:hypothetical protein n=1 Tax=Pareuzebyella sediminis TaxID=2607998 RepID=UPI0011EF4B9B|nr:hypothetical protein [Pareuzebyella sediminis]
MKRTIRTLSLILLWVQTGNAQGFFEKISQNEWKGSGELLKRSASFQMDWRPILDGKFYELSFQNQQDASKEYRFKSKGIYRPWENGTFTGTWFDSRGYSFPLKGKFTENELIVYWGNPETEEGKTTYRIKDNGTVSVIDYILKDGKLIPFGNALYQKP